MTAPSDVQAALPGQEPELAGARPRLASWERIWPCCPNSARFQFLPGEHSFPDSPKSLQLQPSQIPARPERGGWRKSRANRYGSGSRDCRG